MTFDRRLRAYSIDSSFAFLLVGIFFIALSGIKTLSNELKLTILGIAYIGVYTLPNLISPGQTLGKRIQKVKVIKNTCDPIPKDYLIPSRFHLVLREILKAALTIFSCGFYLFLAGIISSNRKDGRTIHDFLFRTRVIVLTRYADEKIENFVSEDMKDTLRGSRYDD